MATNLSLQEQLSTLPIPRLTTVLRVSFALFEHKSSFERASRAIEEWWNVKGAPFDQALTTTSKELAFKRGRFSVDFARSSELFALSMEEPDSSVDERSWLCDFALRKSGDRSEFGVRLSYRQPQNATQRPQPRAPRFLSELINKVGAMDVRAMENRSRSIDRDSLPFLMELISSPERGLPVVVVSEEMYTRNKHADVDRLAHLLAGTAHVFLSRCGRSLGTIASLV